MKSSKISTKAKKPKKRNSQKKKKTRNRKFLELPFVKVVFGLLLLTGLVLLAGLLTRQFMVQKQPLKSTMRQPAPRKLTFEIFPKTDTPSAKQQQAPAVPFTGDLPKIALIIDDSGYDAAIIKKFAGLNTPLTLSILPQSPFRKTIVNLALDKGYDIMLHQPMEPNEYPKVNPGPGTLLTTMPPDELVGLLNLNLDEIPHIKGVNNHMGSKMTTHSDQMRQIFTVLKKRGLFFIDSRTTAQTICKQSAQLLRVPFAERDVFIDHQLTPDFIERQMSELVRIARTHGAAIGIAHPHQKTFRVLQKLIPTMKASITFVPVSELIEPAGG